MNGLVQTLTELLEKIQKDMYIKALVRLNEKKKEANNW